MNGPGDYIDDRDIIDVDEETPDYEGLLDIQHQYEEVLREMDRLQYGVNNTDDVDAREEMRGDLEQIREMSAEYAAELRIELSELDVTDFVIGAHDPENHREVLESVYGPKVEFLKDRFEVAEDYHQKLRDRFPLD